MMLIIRGVKMFFLSTHFLWECMSHCTLSRSRSWCALDERNWSEEHLKVLAWTHHSISFYLQACVHTNYWWDAVWARLGWGVLVLMEAGTYKWKRGWNEKKSERRINIFVYSDSQRMRSSLRLTKGARFFARYMRHSKLKIPRIWIFTHRTAHANSAVNIFW